MPALLGETSTHPSGRNPNLVSTLRRPYLPGVGRKTSSIGLYPGMIRGGFRGGFRGRIFLGRGGMIIRGRGWLLRGFFRCENKCYNSHPRRGRGRGRPPFPYYGPMRPKSEYLDGRGQIDRKKLLEIATENATKLAMVFYLQLTFFSDYCTPYYHFTD